MSNQKPKTNKPKPSSDDDMEIGGNVSDSFVIHGDGNAIHVDVKKPTSDSSKKKTHPNPKKPNVLIVVAWIGFGATVLAALISVYGNRLSVAPSPTPVPVTVIVFTETIVPTAVPTDTVPPGEPTSTPLPATDTPVPTFTPVPPVAIGQDWIAGCISSLWKAYPSNIPTVERGDGCWKEPVNVFSAENGDLDFLSERGSGPAEVYGLFAPLPESGTVTFTIRLRELKNADLLMGIFAQPDVNSQGLLMIMLNGRVDENVFIQKDPFTYVTIQGTQKIKQGNGYSITFRFDNLSARSIVNPAVFFTDPLSIPSEQKWLFLGYKGLRGSYKIDGTFLNFELK